jgi:hypothetical protein
MEIEIMDIKTIEKRENQYIVLMIRYPDAFTHTLSETSIERLAVSPIS